MDGGAPSLIPGKAAWAVVVTVMVLLPNDVPAGNVCGSNITVVPEGLPEAEKLVVVTVGPPIVIKLIWKTAGCPAATVTLPAGPLTAKPAPDPEPESAIACGLLVELSEIIRLALLVPGAAGENVTAN